MVFTEKFEFKEYGEELKNSYIIVKLFNKQESIDYVKTLANISKDLSSTSTTSEINIDKIMEESESTIDYAYKSIENQFIEGMFYNRESKMEEPMKKEDVNLLPPKIIGEIINIIRGNIQKKS